MLVVVENIRKLVY